MGPFTSRLPLPLQQTFLVNPDYQAIQKAIMEISLVVQWLSLHLLMQGPRFHPWSGN